MAQILLKRSSVAGAVPTSSQLALGEIAINTADGKIFIKDSNGSILSFSKASDFAAAVHSHAISDVTGLQAALDALTSAASAAQSGADASLKIASNLSDLNNAGTARTNLDVYSKSEVDSAVSSAQSAAETAANSYTDQQITDLIAAAPGTLDTLKEIADAIQDGSDVATGLATSIGAVSDRVTTLEGQNLDSRITDAQADADAAQSTADSALKKSDNLSDLASVSTARTNLDVYSKGEADSAISTAVSAAETALQSDIDGIDTRVTTIENLNLGSRLTTAEGAISTLQSDVVAAQSAADAAQTDADAAQSTADSAVTAAATAQSGADASLKISSNLSDLSSATAARTNLSVDSSAEVDSKISTAVSAAQTALENDLNTLEGRVDTAESNISTLQTDVSAAQSTADSAATAAANADLNAEGRASKSANLSDLASASTARTNLSVDSSAEVDAKITAALEVLDGGEFSGFSGGGGGGGVTSYAASFTGSNSVSLAGSFGLGSGDFTIEGFFNRNGDSGSGPTLFCDQMNGAVLYFVGSTMYFGQTGAANIASATVAADSNWHHVAVVRESGTLSIYIDGTQAVSVSDSTDFTVSGNAVVGALYNLADGFVGKVGSFRVSSVARYSGSSYTVPTGTFTSDGSTLRLLLQGSSVDGGLTANGSVSMVQGPF